MAVLFLRMQVRGSIPLFWHQEGGGSRLKPDILLQQYDPLYSATRLHIDDLRRRYGASCSLCTDNALCPAAVLEPVTAYWRKVSCLRASTGSEPPVKTAVRAADRDVLLVQATQSCA